MDGQGGHEPGHLRPGEPGRLQRLVHGEPLHQHQHPRRRHRLRPSPILRRPCRSGGRPRRPAPGPGTNASWHRSRPGGWSARDGQGLWTTRAPSSQGGRGSGRVGYPGNMDVARRPLADALEHAGALLAGAGRIVVFTGAGVSTDLGDSGLPVAGGLWTRYDPRQLGFRRYVSDPGTRRLACGCGRSCIRMDARPNPAHLACVRLARGGAAGRGDHPEHRRAAHRRRAARRAGLRGARDRAPVRLPGLRRAGADGRGGGQGRGRRGGPGLPGLRGSSRRPRCRSARTSRPRSGPGAEALTAACDAFVAVGSSLVVSLPGLPVKASRLGASW